MEMGYRGALSQLPIHRVHRVLPRGLESPRDSVWVQGKRGLIDNTLQLPLLVHPRWIQGSSKPTALSYRLRNRDGIILTNIKKLGELGIKRTLPVPPVRPKSGAAAIFHHVFRSNLEELFNFVEAFPEL